MQLDERIAKLERRLATANTYTSTVLSVATVLMEFLAEKGLADRRELGAFFAKRRDETKIPHPLAAEIFDTVAKAFDPPAPERPPDIRPYLRLIQASAGQPKDSEP